MTFNRLLPALALLAACGGDATAPAETIPEALAAQWVAEPACLPQCGFTLISIANPADSLNATSFAGITTQITMTRNGTFRLSLLPGPDTASTASVRASGASLVITDNRGVVDTLDYTLSGTMLQLRFRRTFRVIDFNGDGQLDPASARGTFRRR